MRAHWKFALKICVTVLVIALVWFGINRLLISKHFANESWPETTTASEFYDLEENSVDVLFLGSSHAVSAFIPQELYDNYGITSYNLGMEQQSVVVSYYWLKEALQTQSPSIVVFDAYILFEYNREEVLNSSEASVRLAMDFMKNGKVKWEAVNDICALDENQTVLSYYLTNIRYHTRWTDLNASDFLYEEYNEIDGLMGYSTCLKGTVSASYEPFAAGSSDDDTEMISLMAEYLEKILTLCEENDIDFVLVKTPTIKETIQKYNALVQFSEEHNIPLYDFNEESLYHEVEFEYQEDMADDGHLGFSGAKKITNFLGQLFQTEYGMESHESTAWEESEETYKDISANYYLSQETDLREYLSALKENKDRYTVFIAVKDEASNGLTDELKTQLRELGLCADWSGAYRKSYYAVIESGSVRAECISEEEIEFKGSLHDGQELYYISSAGYNVGNTCSITIDGTEYAKNGRGLNIVVYDNERHRVIDQVCFDTHSEELTATR